MCRDRLHLMISHVKHIILSIKFIKYTLNEQRSYNIAIFDKN
jgi:hypothetical protein